MEKQLVIHKATFRRLKSRKLKYTTGLRLSQPLEWGLRSCGTWHRVIRLRVPTFRYIHIEKSKKMQQCIKIYYSIFVWSSTCFGRRTAHHQEPKTALAAFGLRTWKVVGPQPTTLLPSTLKSLKPEAVNAVVSSWWWAWRRPKHVERHKTSSNKLVKLLHLVG